MLIDVAGRSAYAYTGGRPFDPALPCVVFIHGAQHDHSVWALQSRYFAYHGFSVLAVDLPGHHRSAGPPCDTIGAMADWLAALLDAAGVARAMLVGHSMGSLIALQSAARDPRRVTHLALLACAYPMQVSAALLEAAAQRPAHAIEMVNGWSHSGIAAKPSNPGPGFWLHGSNQRLMERVAQNSPAAVFHIDFMACNGYDQGLQAAAAVRCPSLCLLGRHDLMTPVRASRALVDALAAAGAPVETVVLEAGHALMSEQPDATLDALIALSRRPA